MQVKGRGRAPYSSSGYTADYYDGRIRYQDRVDRTDNYRTQLLATVYIDNPNLALANQLGFVNPATVAWELVPFSFLVDWFVPVGRFLSTWTDFAGYQFLEPTTTRYVTTTYVFTKSNSRDGVTYVEDKTRTTVMRTSGIATPSITDMIDFKLSPWRAATAVALLLQTFRGR